MNTSIEEIQKYMTYLTQTWENVVKNEIDAIDAASELIF